jgi:hypothetical protein
MLLLPRARRSARLLPLVLGGFAVLASPAQATFHLEKVNEVMLASSSGDSSVQFVELLDRGGSEEQFTPVFAPYKLVVYDGAANKLGEHTLNPDGLRAADSGREYLISTTGADAAFGVTGDEHLDVSLPTGAGQACFEANPNPPAFSCLTWGAVTKPVPTNSNGTGSVNGPVPPNGASDQRQADNTVVAATPTPKAPNHSTAPGTPGVATPFAGLSFASRIARVSRSGRAAVRLRCPAGTNGSCRGRLALRATRGRRTFGRAKFNIPASKTKTVRVKLSRRALRRLKGHRRLGARVRVVAQDAAGTSRTSSARLTLVRPR